MMIVGLINFILLLPSTYTFFRFSRHELALIWLRMVVDYRKIKDDTDQDAYPLPVKYDILDQLAKAKFFSAFDLSVGFHQIPMRERDK